MRMRKLLLLLLVCCGGGAIQQDAGIDIRSPFLGDWSGQFVATVTISGATQQSQGSTSWTMSKSTISEERIAWSTSGCSYQGRVTTDSSFTVDPVTCPTQVTDAGCTVSIDINNGSGSRTGTTMRVTLGGDAIAQCSGGNPQTGTYTATLDVAKN